MSDNSYAIEQEVHDRIADAYAFARAQSAAKQVRPRHSDSHAMCLARRVRDVLVKAKTRAFDRSRAGANPRTAT